MKLPVTVTTEVKPADLAAMLVLAKPEEFADFWFQFHKKLEVMEEAESEKILMAFAEAMAPQPGNNRKKPFLRLYQLISLHETLRSVGRSLEEKP